VRSPFRAPILMPCTWFRLSGVCDNRVVRADSWAAPEAARG
jgi:hypothetical protein